MLEIKKGDFFLDLYPDTVISCELNNPVMEDDIIKGNYSFPFRVPLTPKNKRLFNFPEEIANTASIQIADSVEVWVDGIITFPTATINIKDVSPGSINAFILVGVSTFADFASNHKLADLVDFPVKTFDDINFAGPFAPDFKAYAKSTLTSTVDTYPFVFPTVVNNGHYLNAEQQINGGYTKDVAYNVYIDNEFKIKEQTLVNTNVPAGSQHGHVTMVPFLYVTYILRRIFQGFNLDVNIFETDPGLKKLLLFNSFSLDKWYEYVSEYFFNFNNRAIDVKNHVPDMNVGEFLIALKKVFCLFFYKDPFRDKIYFDAFKNVVSDPSYVDWTSIASMEYGLEENIGKGLKYLPEMGTDAVLQATGTMLNVVRKSSVVHEVDLPVTGNTIGDVRMVEETGQLYTWQFIVFFPTWIPYTNALGDYYSPPAGYEIKNTIPGMVPTKVKFYPTENFNAPDEYLVPSVKAPGSYLDSGSKQVTSSMIKKLFFYHGMRSSQNGRPYPFASSHNYDRDKVKVGAYSLVWDGNDGLNNVWWKPFLEMKENTKQVTRDINLNMMSLLKLDFRKKVRIGSSNFLIKKISLQLPLRKPAKVELWKVDA